MVEMKQASQSNADAAGDTAPRDPQHHSPQEQHVGDIAGQKAAVLKKLIHAQRRAAGRELIHQHRRQICLKSAAKKKYEPQPRDVKRDDQQ